MLLLDVDTDEKVNIEKMFFLEYLKVKQTSASSSKYAPGYGASLITQSNFLKYKYIVAFFKHQKKADVEEKMKSKKLIKKAKQHQLQVTSASIYAEIGEPQSRVKHSSSLPQGDINYLGVTKSNVS